MTYNAQEARVQMLQDVVEALEDLGRCVAALGEAYEQLDERTGDELEQTMFRPAQHAYGLGQRVLSGFAERHRLPPRAPQATGPGAHAADPRVYVERAVSAAEAADERLAALQDSLMPVEVGDQELRAGLAETRTLIARVPEAGRALMRTRGR